MIEDDTVDGAALSVDIRASTDAATAVNIVHHSYFNLSGHGSGTILDHQLEALVDADRELRTALTQKE